MNSAEPAAARRVFLSYASEDHALAHRISDALAQSGIRATNQVWEASPREDFIARLRENIRASDVVVVLLSRAAWANLWVGTETEVALSRDLDKRGAELIPVPHVQLRVLDGVELKRLLRRFPAVSERHFGGTAKSKPGPDGDS